MKKSLLLLAVLSAACISFAGDANAAADKAKCDAKAAKCCCGDKCSCCCCCAKDEKACAKDKAACADKKDAKPAAATPGKP